MQKSYAVCTILTLLSIGIIILGTVIVLHCVVLTGFKILHVQRFSRHTALPVFNLKNKTRS